MIRIQVMLLVVTAFMIVEITRLSGASAEKGYVKERRRRATKGAATQLGLMALKQLLNEAKFLTKLAYGEKVYIKNGGYERALQDFYDVKPTDVRDLRIGTGKQGRVGDKVIRVLDAVGYVSMPALSIAAKNGKGLPQIIIKYKN